MPTGNHSELQCSTTTHWERSLKKAAILACQQVSWDAKFKDEFRMNNAVETRKHVQSQ